MRSAPRQGNRFQPPVTADRVGMHPDGSLAAGGEPEKLAEPKHFADRPMIHVPRASFCTTSRRSWLAASTLRRG